MIDGEPIAMGPEEQVQPPLQEARLARAEAEEAVQRVQQRIEHLACLSEALERPEGGDGMAQSKLQIAAAKHETARNMNTVAKLTAMSAEYPTGQDSGLPKRLERQPAQ
jgi:hypothetical protein